MQFPESTLAPQRQGAPCLTPFDLDRRADLELSAGRHFIAEKLSHLAAELRQTGADRDERRVPR